MVDRCSENACARLLWLVLLVGVTVVGRADFGPDHSLIGLLPLPEVFGQYPCEDFEARDVAVYSAPGDITPVGLIAVTRHWTFAPVGGCEGLQVQFVGMEGMEGTDLPTLEFGYEQPAAIVLARREDWFELALSDERSGWVRMDDPERFLEVPDLLADALTYLRSTEFYDGPSRPESIIELPANKTWPVDVIATQEHAGELWVQVRLLAVEPCTDQATGLESTVAWVRFLRAEEGPAVWFYSRGC